MELIINATLLLAAIVLRIYGQYWRKKCGKVLCQYAETYDEREDREKPLRQAIIAGNPHAPLLYALTCPELFDKVRPLRLFSFGSIRCVFTGHYFPNALKAGFVMTGWHSCKKYMISRMEKTAVRNIYHKHSCFFPLMRILLPCLCRAAHQTAITDVSQALPVFWKRMAMSVQGWI